METKKNRLIKPILFLIIIITLLFLWARYINTQGLKINEYGIVNKELPNSFHGIKIVHFSDILYGNTTDLNDIKNIVKKINELKPDVVFFTGDLLNKNINLSDKELNSISKELSKIDTSLYKYAISGDNDLSDYNNYKQTIEDAGFILLNNSNELLYYKNETPIKIVGLTDTLDLENAFKEENTEESFTITLIHEPDKINELKDYKVNLTFAGHSLGGHFKVPFLGGLIKKEGAKTYLDGYYKVNDTTLYVSSGIGTEDFKFRTLNKPSINLYRLYNQ